VGLNLGRQVWIAPGNGVTGARFGKVIDWYDTETCLVRLDGGGQEWIDARYLTAIPAVGDRVEYTGSLHRKYRGQCGVVTGFAYDPPLSDPEQALRRQNRSTNVAFDDGTTATGIMSECLTVIATPTPERIPVTTTTLTFDLNALINGIAATRDAVAAAHNAAIATLVRRKPCTPEAAAAAYYGPLAEGLAAGWLTMKNGFPALADPGDAGCFMPVMAESWTVEEVERAVARAVGAKEAALAPFDQAIGTLGRLSGTTLTLPEDHEWVRLQNQCA
jgi:hypothetical protein